MEYLIALIYGAVQGLTEFLPVSSSGHLVLLHKYFPLAVSDDLMFDVILHAATLLAVTFYFRRDLADIALSWLRGLRRGLSGQSKMGWLIIIGTVPAALAGFFFEDMITGFFRSTAFVAIMLAAVGAIFIVVEKYGAKIKKLEGLSWRNALAVGCAQALALIPGTSRSGITIVAGMVCRLKREEAVKFSFLLSVPIIAGATLASLDGLADAAFDRNEFYLLAIAFLSALASGFLAIKYFLRIAGSHSLLPFAIYRFALAAAIIAAFYWNKG